MKARYILSMDPSGSFHEGKGTTGLAVMDAVTNKFIYVGFISAHKYECQEEYFNAHLTWIAECMKRYKDDCILSIEDYILYSSNARSHINSHMETSQLIGLIKWWFAIDKLHRVYTIINHYTYGDMPMVFLAYYEMEDRLLTTVDDPIGEV